MCCVAGVIEATDGDDLEGGVNVFDLAFVEED